MFRTPTADTTAVPSRGHAHCRPGMLMDSPFWICPHPMSRQCFSTRRLSAIFSPSLVHTGDVSCSFARSPFTCSA